MTFGKTLAALALLSCAGAAQAHFVWLERSDDGTSNAYFGEWADNEREKFDGLLSKVLANPVVTTADGKTVKSSGNGVDSVTFSTKARGDVRLLQPYVYGDTLVMFGAKAGRQDTSAKLDLELVPTAADADTFVLRFQGKPLSKTEVTVFGPPKWQKNFTSDDAGRITISTPWPGQYVMETAHTENKAGESDGKPYAKIRHVSTLTFNLSK